MELIDSPDPPQRSQVRSFWNRLTASTSSGSELGLHPRAVVDGLLNNLLVPLQGLVEFIHPHRVLVLGLPVNERNAVGRLLDDELFFSLHFEFELAVEGDPCSCTCILGQSDSDLSVGRENDGSECEGVGADRSQADHLSLGVRDRSTAGHVVSCASSRCSEHNSISLNDSPENIVDIDIKSAHELSTSSSDSNFIQSVALCWGVLSRSIAVDHHSLLRHYLFSDHVFQSARQSQSVVNASFVCFLFLCFS